MNKVLKVFLFLGIIAFLFIYISYRNGYYIKRNEEEAILTEEKIKEYENDLKNGVDVSQKTYITIRDNYDNNYSRFLLGASHKIEKGIDSIIKFIFGRISKTINE